MRELSIVIPILNEEDNIFPLVQAIKKSITAIDYEIVFVDDGSTDTSKRKVLELLDEKIVLIELKMNYGQSTAMYAGIDQSTGKYIALMDGDLQNDPDDIPFMLEKLKAEDWDIVAGNRKNRKDGMFLRKIPSKIANALIRRMTKVYIQDYGCTLKVFKREIAMELKLHGELHRFIPVIASFAGARITEVDVKHYPRQSGKSKYGLNRTLRVASDLLMLVFFKRYSQKPMHLFGTMGFICSFSGAGVFLYLLGLKVFMGDKIGGRPLLILGAILLLSGIQFISIGIIIEAIFRTNPESLKGKAYGIRKVYRRNKKSGT
jgi:glycosyltransferase involved in cell wall biosynthesis